ncbi:unnamed protein product [Closterium sp. NIES-53]
MDEHQLRWSQIFGRRRGEEELPWRGGSREILLADYRIQPLAGPEAAGDRSAGYYSRIFDRGTSWTNNSPWDLRGARSDRQDLCERQQPAGAVRRQGEDGGGGDHHGPTVSQRSLDIDGSDGDEPRRGVMRQRRSPDLILETSQKLSGQRLSLPDPRPEVEYENGNYRLDAVELRRMAADLRKDVERARDGLITGPPRSTDPRQETENGVWSKSCHRSTATLVQVKQELQFLPIKELQFGFRWFVDLARELPLSRQGNRYIVVMMEHVSKWLEVRALPNKSSKIIAEAFQEQVLCQFGPCAEELTNQGSEFQGEFKKLLDQVEISCRRTPSRYLPQSDGLTERMVQSLTRGLRVYAKQRTCDWDEDYTGWLRGIGSVDNWVALAGLRAKYLKGGILPAALDSVDTAEMWGARRYEQRQRRGGGAGTDKRTQAGQEVYVRGSKGIREGTLNVGFFGTERWRVKEVRMSGVLVLEKERGVCF